MVNELSDVTNQSSMPRFVWTRCDENTVMRRAGAAFDPNGSTRLGTSCEEQP